MRRTDAKRCLLWLASATLIIAIVLMMTGCGSGSADKSQIINGVARSAGEQWYESAETGGQYKCQALLMSTGELFAICMPLDWKPGEEEKIENEEVGFFASVKNWFKGDQS